MQTISFDAPGVGESTPYTWPRRMPGVARTAERLLDALGYGRSTCSGSRSAASSPSSSPTRHRHGCAGWCSPPPDPGLGGVSRAHRGRCWRWPPRAATTSPTTTGASPGASTAARPAATPTRCCTARSPGSSTARRLRGYLGQLYAIAGWTERALAAPPAAADARAGRRRRPDRAGGQRPHPGAAHPRRHGCTSCRGGGHLFVLEDPAAVASEVAEFLSAAPAGRA